MSCNLRFYYRRLSDYTLTASAGSATGYPTANLKTYLVRDIWKSAASTNAQTLVIDLGSAQAVDHMVIDGHNIGSMTQVDLQYASDSGFTANTGTAISNMPSAATFASGTTTDIYEFTSVTRRYWRLVFTNTNSTVPQIGQVFLGARLEFTYPYDFGYRRDDAEFATSRRMALDGTIRGAQSISGRRAWELTFSLMSNTDATAVRTWVNTVRGGLFPFYVLDVDKTTIRYMLLEADSLPIQTDAYDLNTVQSFKLIEQLATTT